MSDYQLLAYHSSAARFSADANHPKQALAIKALPLIEAEMKRRANALGEPAAPSSGATVSQAAAPDAND